MLSRFAGARPRYNSGVTDEREHEVQHEPQVLEGEDELPRQPAPRLDPYTPEPGPARGERRAFRVMRLAIVPVLVVVAIVLIAALR
jgi:hypothetical protein